MCTLSLVPRAAGFLLAMNRDEQRSRPVAFPPSIRRCGERLALYPSEHEGGTWIGINDRGLTLALLNWYSGCPPEEPPPFSRGLIIPKLFSVPTIESVTAHLHSLPLDQLGPFRLIAIYGRSRSLREYRSDRHGFETLERPWELSHWFSSGSDETRASEIRGATCRGAALEDDAGSVPWLQRLHRSHHPEPGADSICIHREDAVTVSMTLVTVTGNRAFMSYHNGSPCRESRDHTEEKTLDLLDD